MIEVGRHAPPFPALLTTATHKGDLFSVDSYFSEAWHDLERLVPDPTTFAWEHGLLVLKPDAFAARRAGAVLEWLDDLGVVPAAVRRVRFTRHSIRAVWRYQWNLATPERKALMDDLLTGWDSLLLVVRDREPARGRRPVTVRVTDAKGPADAQQRRPEHLRARLGLASTVLSFVHTADEPADVIRELGVHFAAQEREAFIDGLLLRPDARAEAAATCDALSRAIPARTLDAREVGERLLAEIEAVPRLHGDVAVTLRHHAEQLRDHGHCVDWRNIAALAMRGGVTFDAWDDIVLTAAHIVPNESGRETWINTRADDWHTVAQTPVTS